MAGSYLLSDADRALWNYRVGRAVGSAFDEVRAKLRARVTKSGGVYEELWDQGWWVQAVDAEVQPVLRRMYREIARDAAIALGLVWLLRSNVVESAAEELLVARMGVIYGVGATVDGRVAVASIEASGEAPGWLLERLGLFDGGVSGPLSEGVARVMIVTETNSGLNAAAGSAFDLVGELDELDGVEIPDELIAAGVEGSKVWICQLVDSRESHVAANGQVVGPGDLFMIGGFAAEYPGDIALPAAESVNCQCVVEYTIGSGS